MPRSPVGAHRLEVRWDTQSCAADPACAPGMCGVSSERGTPAARFGPAKEETECFSFSPRGVCLPWELVGGGIHDRLERLDVHHL